MDPQGQVQQVCQGHTLDFVLHEGQSFPRENLNIWLLTCPNRQTTLDATTTAIATLS
jgi:hypothetical protein